MSDSLMFNNEAYVVLETNRPEELLTPAEMLAKLQQIAIEFPDDLPIDIQKITDPQQRFQALMETSCELYLSSGNHFQWYIVRLEK
jgi:hypothetical protein